MSSSSEIISAVPLLIISICFSGLSDVILIATLSFRFALMPIALSSNKIGMTIIVYSNSGIDKPFYKP